MKNFLWILSIAALTLGSAFADVQSGASRNPDLYRFDLECSFTNSTGRACLAFARVFKDIWEVKGTVNSNELVNRLAVLCNTDSNVVQTLIYSDVGILQYVYRQNQAVWELFDRDGDMNIEFTGYHFNPSSTTFNSRLEMRGHSLNGSCKVAAYDIAGK